MEGNKPKVQITKIRFNDGTEYTFQPSDVVVFVGANNAGKSQILRDINSYFENKETTRIIAKEIELCSSGNPIYFREHAIERNGSFHFSNTSYNRIDIFENQWNNKNYSTFKNFLLKTLSTEQRLSDSRPVNTFNSVLEFPQNPIQELYIDDAKETFLSGLMQKAFNLDMIVNRCAGSVIPIHIGQKPPMEVGEDRVSGSYLKKLNNVPQAQNQGDGVRSYLGILLNVFVTPHPIMLIDEPEAFLHPPQARLLGKTLAEELSGCGQIFISSHSGDFIKGLLDSHNENIKIIHVNRVDNVNYVNMLDNCGIANIWKDPILRYSNILDGLFHSKVVICESDSDCRFYQAVLNACFEENDDVSDILFVQSGGKHRLKTIIPALKALNVKTMAVADIDVFNDRTTFKDVVETLGLDWSEIKPIWEKVNEFAMKQERLVAISEFQDKLNNIIGNNDGEYLTETTAKKIKDSVKLNLGWSCIKENGRFSFEADPVVLSEFDLLLDKCYSAGLLVVPVGELECFYKTGSLHGPKWVNNILETIADLKNDSRLQNARDFVTKILEF